ncbi:hypothetical protein AB0F91_32725 [Amycolatopsis sp. NPDC023774]|uniref:hypothetical protein n=1 Tax=Amycolatopsis sp. NPDC023774 TaxID=3155015 RepID=UPI0033E69B79
MKMPPDHELGPHGHETWVSVFVVDGVLKWAGGGERELGAGDFSFVQLGEEHVETSLETTTVLIIKTEPDVQCPSTGTAAACDSPEWTAPGRPPGVSVGRPRGRRWTEAGTPEPARPPPRRR